MTRPWTFPARMAWRDSRGARRNLTLFILAAAIGIAAIVAIRGFGDTLTRAVDDEAAAILGADLVVKADQPFTSELNIVLDEVGGRRAEKIIFNSMVVFERQNASQLLNVRAMGSGLPFMGAIVTEPVSALEEYQERRGALMDPNVMASFNIESGDTIRIGSTSYPVVGEIVSASGESGFESALSPRIYVPLHDLDTTLVGLGSRVTYESHFKFANSERAEHIADSLKGLLERSNASADTIESTRMEWNEGLTDVYRFLSLMGFGALLLGGIGVGSSVTVHIKRSLGSVALLRCLGATRRESMLVYLFQVLFLGCIAVGLGVGLGVLIQLILPRVFADLLPVGVTFSIAPQAILVATAIGIATTLLFSLMPVLEVWDVSPLTALRANISRDRRGSRLWYWCVGAIVAAGLLFLSIVQAPTLLTGLGYFFSIAGVMAVIYGLALLVIRIARRSVPTTAPFPLRHAVSNLHRPNNQTSAMMLSIGLVSFLMLTMLAVRASLIGQLDQTSASGRANMILFDIQPDQVDGVQATLVDKEVTIVESAPLVTMTIDAVNGISVEDLEADPDMNTTWAHHHEYRSSYRDRLTEAEVLLRGDFVDSYESGQGPIPISLEKDISDDLNVDLGDHIRFAVHGALLETRVASIRKVNWNQVRTNFFVLFPPGAIDEAPRTHVMMARSPSADVQVSAQTALARSFPNVSTINLELILRTIETVLARMEAIVRFLVLFSVIAGVLVLLSAVANSRSQRESEGILLKIIGASRRTVTSVMMWEYLVLGALAVAVGLLLAVPAGYLLARFVFVVPFRIPWIAFMITVMMIVLGTLLVGYIGSSRSYQKNLATAS